MAKSKRRTTVPHNGKEVKVDSIVRVGRAVHHYFTDPVDGQVKDYIEIDHPDAALVTQMEDDEN